MPRKTPKPIQHHEIRRMAVADLKPVDYNPRKIGKEAAAGLRASMETFGLLEPIVYNERSGNVVGGHQRLDVLLASGVETTDVVVVDMDEAAERAANVTLNNHAISGDWDDSLPVLLHEIRESIALEDFMALRLDMLDQTQEGTGEGGEDLDLESGMNYAVQVACTGEEDQRLLIETLEKDGRKCKPLIW